jgi:glycosyltransferase involved in cell wall biosynthesis
MNPKITVLVPTFNRANFLAECLESLINQTLPPSQILVVNDGSEDHTLSVIKPYLDRIEYYETNQLGKPSAINYGLKKVSGDYLWIFDDDDVALPSALLRFVEPLEENRDFDFSFSEYYYTTSREDNYKIGEIKGKQPIPDLTRRGPLIPLLEANYLGGAALFARTSIYNSVGNFDTELYRSQDYEMAIRIVRKFKGIQLEGGPTFHYRQHNHLRGYKEERFEAQEKFKYWLKYDQIFFRKIYKELPLADYLPNVKYKEKRKRQSLLQRIAIMTSKLLFPEVIKDLRLLAQIDDKVPFSREEKAIIIKILSPPFYQMGSIVNFDAFFEEINLLSEHSQMICLLKDEIVSILNQRKKAKNKNFITVKIPKFS